VDPTVAALVGGGVGLALGAAAVIAARYSELTQSAIPDAAPSAVPPGLSDVLAVLRSVAIVLDASDAVVNTSASAVSYGLVRHGELVYGELRDLARQTRRDGVIREIELELSRGPVSAAVMRARVAPLGASQVLVLAEDHTQARRVEEVRRDFVANISHELKTPVGGIALLAEAIQDAKDDPQAVERFAERIQHESTRLTRLVQDIVDLSRLQVADTLHEPHLVDIGAVVADATDRVRVRAEATGIAIEVSTDPDLRVFGDADLLSTAVGNLISNAVNYSDPGTRVAVAARRRNDSVEVTVSDQGHGIPASEQERIFERFYRVDPARSRATGGTGLGLAIVKHVCATHGGDVSVWSEEGHGSTFTITLPSAPEPERPAPAAPTTERARAGSTQGGPAT
jgi:two-component system sensor histidine kinase SenX3